MKRLVLAFIFVLGLVPCSWADYQHGRAAYSRGDYIGAWLEFVDPAEQGDARAQLYLGLMYQNGQGVQQDYVEAVKWYRMAAEQGYANGQVGLGIMYQRGRGVPQDYFEAMKWYRRAAEQGDTDAQFALGFMYEHGRGVPPGVSVLDNYVEAVKWYRMAAEKGDAKSQIYLGDLYFFGLGIPKDYVEAHMWFNLAAAGVSRSSLRDQTIEYKVKVAKLMTSAQIAEAQRRAAKWRPSGQ